MTAAPKAAAVLALAAALACPPSPNPADAAAPARVLVDAERGTAAVRVEIARTPEAQERGLMYRKALDADAGMVFVFDVEKRHPFWMANTLVPLDMLFISAEGRVAAIVERAPLGLESDDGGVDSRYVLEVNRGWSRAHGVKKGDRVRFENVLF
jgi:uncharacterized membrane protein (UPF0127 family)